MRDQENELRKRTTNLEWGATLSSTENEEEECEKTDAQWVVHGEFTLGGSGKSRWVMPKSRRSFASYP